MATIRSGAPVVLIAVVAALLAGCSSPAPDPSPTDEPVTADACRDLVLEAGAVVAGDELGACIQERMLAAGSYRAAGTVTNSQQRLSTALVELDPFRVFLDTNDEDDPHALILTDDASWGQFGPDWVAAGSDDPRASEIGPLAVLTLATYSSSTVGSLLSSAGSWNVIGQQDAGWLLQPTSPPSTLGVPLQDASLLVGEDWLPIRTSATGTFDAQATTSVQDYRDWGADLDFPALPGS